MSALTVLSAAPATDSRAAVLRERFVSAMAELAAGVSVITSVGLDGEPVGATVTSAASASADPPIISVSLSRSSRSLAPIRARKAFVLNVLRFRGQTVAGLFSTNTADQFTGVGWELTRQGLPWLPRVCAYAAACRLITEVPAGDHLLLLGAVEEIYPEPGAAAREWAVSPDPLVYWRRAYHTIR